MAGNPGDDLVAAFFERSLVAVQSAAKDRALLGSIATIARAIEDVAARRRQAFDCR